MLSMIQCPATGKLAASLRGACSALSPGKLSKQGNAVTMRRPATIGNPGGLILVDVTPAGRLQVSSGTAYGVP